jgi:hypothetical protein
MFIKLYSVVKLYPDDVMIDVITIRENSKFSLTPFYKRQVVTLTHQRFIRTEIHFI